MDPITKEMDKKPMKPFMVNQLQIAFERDRLILSPYDETLAKQLTDYEVEKITEAGLPKYTSENEHFVDALGLAYLAMVLEFKELTGTVEDIRVSSEFTISKKKIGGSGMTDVGSRPIVDSRITDFYENNDWDDLPSDRKVWVEVDMDYRSSSFASRGGWGSRKPGGMSRGFGR